MSFQVEFPRKTLSTYLTFKIFLFQVNIVTIFTWSTVKTQVLYTISTLNFIIFFTIERKIQKSVIQVPFGGDSFGAQQLRQKYLPERNFFWTTRTSVVEISFEAENSRELKYTLIATRKDRGFQLDPGFTKIYGPMTKVRNFLKTGFS